MTTLNLEQNPEINQAIDVWIVNTDSLAQSVQIARQYLNGTELLKAESYLRPLLQSRFIVRRAALRQILSHYVNLHPCRVNFEIGPHGKPRLSQHIGQDLHFNLSHSNGLVAVAVCLGSELGIDIEQFRIIPNAAKIVAEFFSPIEQQAFSSTPAADQNLYFLKLWTRKEAFLKATGKGLSFPLDQIDVSPEIPTLTPPPGRNEEKGDPLKRWSLIELPTHPDFIGAIVVDGEKRSLRQRDFAFAKFD
jgi:4'-phosphopantetheinyl transferase